MAWTTLILSEAVGEHNICWAQQLHQWLAVLKARWLPWLQPPMVAISGMSSLDPKPVTMLEEQSLCSDSVAWHPVLELRILKELEPGHTCKQTGTAPGQSVGEGGEHSYCFRSTLPMVSAVWIQEDGGRRILSCRRRERSWPALQRIVNQFFALADSKGPRLPSDPALYDTHLASPFLVEPWHVQQM